MDNFRWPLVGVVMFLMVITLSTGIYTEFDNSYNFQYKNTVDSNVTGVDGNIGEQLRVLANDAVSGFNQTQEGLTGVLSGLTSLKPNPLTNAFDVIGGLQNVAIGALKSVLVLFTAPLAVLGMILEFYVGIPAVVTYVGTIIFIFVLFILVSLYLRSDL